jgi:hypothetical protein
MEKRILKSEEDFSRKSGFHNKGKGAWFWYLQSVLLISQQIILIEVLKRWVGVSEIGFYQGIVKEIS